MKKIFYVISVICLLAAGCSTSTENSTQQSTSFIPAGAETEYREIFNNVSQKCGNQVSLQYVLISLNPNAETHPHSYFFTPGTCGQPDQSLSIIYETTTHKLNPSWNILANSGGILQPIPLQNWKINYNQALNYASQNGGQDFINNNPGAIAWTVELDNRKAKEFRWTIRYRNNNNTSAPQLKIFIDPSDGKLLGKE